MSDTENKQTVPLAETLTPREQEVLALVGKQRTNQQIADKLVIAYSTVRWYLRQISNKLGVSGRDAIVERAQVLGLIARPAAPPRQTSNLPTPPTRFVGRESELQALGELLLDPHTRLITIVGPGGIGKTRMALALAERQVVRHIPGSKRLLFPDGVWFVSSASLQAVAELLPAIAAAVDLDLDHVVGEERALKRQLHDFLRRKRLLLVLDNLEHLPDAAPLLAELLAAAPQITLLVASRRRLRMQGERVFTLGGLELPADDRRGSLAANPAVRLFTTTAERVQPSFEVDEPALAAIGRICRLLDGTPLAIELAASWASLLPAEKIEHEVQRGLDILAAELTDVPPRHRSMQATLDVSWARLGAEEQEVFRGLSVFRGGFSRKAAREVAGATLQNLKKLIDASWLSHDQQQDRCEIQELLRQYGESQLQREPDLEQAVRERHAAYFAAFLHDLEDEWYGPRQREALDTVQEEIDNVRLAWRWAVAQGRVSLVAQALESFRIYYDHRGDEGEVRDLLRAASDALLLLEVDSDDVARRRLLARLLIMSARFGFPTEERHVILHQAENVLQSLSWEEADVTRERAILMMTRAIAEDSRDPRASVSYFEEARSLFNSVHDKHGMVRSTLFLGSCRWRMGRQQEALQLFNEALALGRAADNPTGVAEALRLLGIVERLRGRTQQALQVHRESYSIRRMLLDSFGMASAASELVHSLVWVGDFKEASLVAMEAVERANDMGSPSLRTQGGSAAGLVALHCGDYDASGRYLRSALAEAEELENRVFRGWSLAYLAMYRLVTGHYDAAIADAKRAERDIADYRYGLHRLPALFQAYAHLKTGKLAEGRHRLIEALQDAVESRVFLMAVNALPAAAQLLAEQGERQRAVELYALACRYPYVANSSWFADLFADDMAALVSSLASEDVATAVERGRARELWATVEELTVDLKGTGARRLRRQ